MRAQRARRIRHLIAVLATISIGGVLAGCVPTQATSTPASPTIAPSASASAGLPAPRPKPTLDPTGTAQDNAAYFRAVGYALLHHHDNVKGRKIIDTFVKAGFNKKDMEITPDKTSIGLDAWNIEFSVRMNGTCLIGQSGNVDFHYFVAPLLSTGRCLIGRTRTIDW